jgi:tellurite resistance protein
MIEKDIQQPIVPEAQNFVAEVNKRIEANSEYASTAYGHAAANLACILEANTFYDDPIKAQEKQRQAMIIKAQRLLDEFGPNIIMYLKEELKLVIEEEKLH